jgi:hypothetical protein
MDATLNGVGFDVLGERHGSARGSGGGTNNLKF